MAIVERAKNICLKPATEWGVIAEEQTSTADLYKRYVIPLAAIGPLAGFVGNSIVGRSIPLVGTYRFPIGTGLGIAVTTFVLALVGVFVLSLIINALAPKFGGEKNPAQALKLAVYSYTPAWIAGALQIVSMLALLGLIAGLYGLYLLYLGLPRLMKCPPDRAVGYTVVVVLCAIGIGIVMSLVGGAIAGPNLPAERATADVQFDKDSAMGKLQALGKAIEASNKKMDTAQRSGDQAAQTAAAMEAVGALMGGGKRVSPVSIDQLKPFIPETFAGLPKKSSKAERAGVAGMMIAKAEAGYADGGKRASLDIADTGGASGMLALAGWAGVQGEKEDDNSFERTQTVDGRLVHEKGSKRGGSNEFTIILGQRFIVTAKGQGVDLATLKTAVTALDLGKLEGMKDVGVEK
jgi:hypothetical protein